MASRESTERVQGFKPVDPKVDLPAMERDILAWWEKAGMVQKYLHRNDASSKRYSFIDGPITANNPMGVHHAWGRTYKDLFQRYKTMQGFKQRYQNGFDCQGLWIEVEVEKELGFKSKKDIEEYGIDRFVELCKERVHKFADIQTQQSIRLGYWMDWDNSYYTLSDENNYTIWHFLKVCQERGWIYEGTDVMPWCPRCGTGLSEHEIVTEGYREIMHPGLFVRFPLEGREQESLLAWTTTPWTLSSNVAAAVHPELTYVKARVDNETLYLAKARLSSLRGDYTVEEEFPGKELEGLRYGGPFDELPAQEGVEHRVVLWNEVSEAEGTGIVHIAPGAGKEDFALGKKHGLAVIAPLDDSGTFVDGFDWLTGMSVAEVNQPIFDHLRRKGALYHLEQYSHRYPVCWRCETELVFRLVSEWFISMDELRHLIADVTRKIRWIPEFGLRRELDWLQNMDDWMISKKRYWGLALPIYKCVCGHFEVIGSETELKERAVEGWERFEGHTPHRPWVDEVKIRCQSCGEVVSRIKDVGTPWLDAGIAPFSTLDYRHNRSYWQDWFPADWVSESFPGQFRNWFYSLLTMGTVLENQEPFRCVFSYALMRDEKGQEMHKSRGTAIWFEEAAEEIGVDTMRWLFVRQNPAANLNFGPRVANEVRRSFFLTLWNTYSFFVTYANIDGYNPKTTSAIKPSAELDRWILSELNTLIHQVDGYLDDYDSAEAARHIEEFVEALSNWYVRRSRRRFWKSENDEDKLSAYATLHQCLVILSKLMAPMVPFIAEEMYQNLVRSVDPTAPESVHLTSFPVADPSRIDPELTSATRLAMRLSSMGRAARSKAGIRVRQPLAEVWVKVGSPTEEAFLEAITPQVMDEVNVKKLSILRDEGEVVEFEIRANQALLGPKYGAETAKIAEALALWDPNQLAAQVRAGALLLVGAYTLLPQEVEVSHRDKAGYSVVMEGDYTFALSTKVTPELAREGLAREIVHRIQDMRRSANFDIADHIVTYYQGGPEVSSVIAAFGGYVAQETLSNRLLEAVPDSGAYVQEYQIDGIKVTLGVMKAGG